MGWYDIGYRCRRLPETGITRRFCGAAMTYLPPAAQIGRTFIMWGHWVRYSGGRAVYRGRITRAPFTAWTRTAEGRAAIERHAAELRLPWFAKARTTTRLWQQLSAAAKDPSVAATIQSELDLYLERLQQFAYAEGLPRVGVDLHRLVVVPRVLVNGTVRGAIARRLNAQPAFAMVEGGDAIRELFVQTLVDHADAAVARTSPSLRRPLPAGRHWISVGVNGNFVWRVPLLKEPPWDGHHYVLELTRDPITRALRKAVAAAIAQVESALPGLSRSERNEILKRAAQGAR
jgi:hypothetical protein